MLTLVTGADRISLSETALQHIKKNAYKNGGKWILVVPEQFSFEAERTLCEIGGDAITRYAEVLSFSRLSDRVAATVGGAASTYLDKGGQLMTMALAAEQVVSRIKLYAAVLRKPEFLQDMIRMINELKSCCMEPRDLLAAADKAQGQLAQKLHELGLLYEAYLAVCSNGKADPADKLLRLMQSIAECSWLQTTNIYFDGFFDYTGVELNIIEELMKVSPEVRINIPTGENGSVMHAAAQRTALQLQKIARQNMVEIAEDRVQVESHKQEEIRKLLSHMFSYTDSLPVESKCIKLMVCASVEEECRAAAHEVKTLLSQGARCRDISVACTDMQRYEIPLRNAFLRADLPVYYAGERGLLSKPVVTAVVNSLFAAVGAMDYEDVSLYLKSGFVDLEPEHCDRLDNYAYIWNISGSKWETDWTFHPRGFAEVMTAEDEALLAQLNEDRKRAIAPLVQMRRRLQRAGNTADMVLALYGFMEDVSLQQRLQERAENCAERGDGQAAQELVQIYEIMVTSLEQMWLTLGQSVRTPDDFARLYFSVLTQYQVATIPAGLDQIHVSDLPDLRNRKVKHLLVLGASDGSFPSYKTTEGLLTEEDRLYLQEKGLTIAPGRADQMDLELSKIYFALFSAQDSVCFSYSGDQPAWLFRRAAMRYPDALVQPQEIVLNADELAAWRLRWNDTSACDLQEVTRRQAELDKLRDYTFTPLQEETVYGLYGMPISLSPSKIDKFASCQFAFFLNYGLKAKRRKQAKLDQPAFGTFVHAVLENTILRVNDKGGMECVSKEEILDIATEEIKRYADELFPEQAKRESYLFNRSRQEVLDIVLDLWEELRVSAFQPAFCELKFMDGEMLPAVQISGKKAQCSVIGMVDRVDFFRDKERTYARVVDYKTGVKDFDYTDILNGAGLQMLIYLFALQTAGKQINHGEPLYPAGVLYLPAKREYPLTEPMPEDETVNMKHREGKRRKGLILSEEHVLAAMEEDPQDPKYMPYKNGRNGLKGDLATQQQMKMLERHVMRSIAQTADQISTGEITPNPVVRGQYGACKYCDYKTVCHRDLGTQEERLLANTSAEKFWQKLEQEEKEHG